MAQPVTGTTRLLGIIGDPISQVRAPEVWTALFRRNGIDAICIPMHVGAADLDTFLAGIRTLRNLAGLIVTVPHKPAALACVDTPTARAQRVGAVNVIRWNQDGSVSGDILDGEGFVRGLQARGQTVSGKRTLIVGAGGAGTAIAFAVAQAGAAEIAIADIDAKRAENLVRRLTATGTAARVAVAAAQGFDLIVNASPIGMRADDPLPVDCTGLDAHAIVADAIMHPPLTRLLATARERGCFIQPGTFMMDHQIAAMAPFFGYAHGDWSPEAIAQVAAVGA